MGKRKIGEGRIKGIKRKRGSVGVGKWRGEREREGERGQRGNREGREEEEEEGREKKEIGLRGK